LLIPETMSPPALTTSLNSESDFTKRLFDEELRFSFLLAGSGPASPIKACYKM
jgi:hypothetical protein